MKRIFVLPFGLLALVTLLLVTLSHSAVARAAAPLIPRVYKMTHHDKSAPLSKIPAKPFIFRQQRDQPVNRLSAHSPAVAAALPDEPDEALDLLGEEEGKRENMPDPITGWTGINAVNSFCSCAPPDTNGDVGLNHYVQTVNTALKVWDKSGNALLGPIPNNTLFSGFGGKCETTNDGDPIVLYDHLADRWFFSQFANVFSANGPYYQCIAVSTTGDPTGSWYRYEFLYPGGNILNDYPKFGVWPDAYYATVNQFRAPSFHWAGTGVLAFERDKMLNGQAAQVVYFDLGPTDWGGMLPSDLDGPAPAAGTPNYFVEVQDKKWDPTNIPQDQITVHAFDVDWTTPANSTFTNIANLAVAKFNGILCGFGPCIPQKGTTNKLDTLGDRTMYRAQYRDFGSYATIVTNHTVNAGEGRAGVRWYELRVTGGTPSIYQQSTFAPGSAYRWMGSAAMDEQGNLAIGYSGSSPKKFPNISYAGRLAGDPLNSLAQGSKTMKKGGGAQIGTDRWGDYSMLAVDPSDGCTFWYTTEFLKQTGGYNWSTWIGTFKFPGCS